MSFLERNLNRMGQVGTDNRDELEVPRIALREAIANALIHRDYEILNSRSQPTRVEITQIVSKLQAMVLCLTAFLY